MTTDLPADDQIERVRVVNRNDITIHDRFDGVPYIFKPNVPVDLALDVAQHILNYPADGEEAWRYMAKRWGWNLPKHMGEDEAGVPLWARMARNMVVTTERFELRRVTDPRAAIPADDGVGGGVGVGVGGGAGVGVGGGVGGGDAMLEPPVYVRKKESMADRMAKVREARKRKKVQLAARPQHAQQPQPVPPVPPLPVTGV